MVLAPFERMRSLRREAEGDFETLQDRIEQFDNVLVEQPHLDGRLIEDIAITTGSNDINHKLGRRLRGWWIVSDTATPAGFRVHLASTDTGAATNSSASKVEFDTEAFDYGGAYDLATNNRFDAPQAGLYDFSASVWLSAVPDGTRFEARLYRNGSVYSYGRVDNIGAGDDPVAHVAVNGAEATSAGDYFEIYVFHQSGTNEDVNAGSTLTWFSGHALTGCSADQSELSDAERTTTLRLYSQCDRTLSVVVF